MITEQSLMLPHKAVFNPVIPHSTITVAGPLIREMEWQTSALIAVICACDPIPSIVLMPQCLFCVILWVEFLLTVVWRWHKWQSNTVCSQIYKYPQIMWPWTTKPVLSVHFSKLRFIHNLKAFHWCVVCYDQTIFDLKYKIAFKVVQMKFLAMHITNQKWSFEIFTVRTLQHIFMEHDLYLIS